MRISENLRYLKTIKGNHILKNFKIRRLDLTAFNVAPLMALVTIYSLVIPRNSLETNETFGSMTGPGLGEISTLTRGRVN